MMQTDLVLAGEPTGNLDRGSVWFLCFENFPFRGGGNRSDTFRCSPTF